MAVDRGDDRLLIKEHLLEGTAQRRQKVPEIVGPAVERADQIDAGGKNLALAGDDDGPRGRGAQFVQTPDHVFAESAIHGVGLAMAHGENGDFAPMLDFDHAGEPLPCAMPPGAFILLSPASGRCSATGASRCA
jgi:hypothetical protein